MMHELQAHQGRRVRTLLLVIAVFVLLFTIAQISSIDWDIGQRRRQKTAFLVTRQLSAALGIFKRQNGGYPLTSKHCTISL
jgi:predicted metal-dependent hydrolase